MLHVDRSVGYWVLQHCGVTNQSWHAGINGVGSQMLTGVTTTSVDGQDGQDGWYSGSLTLSMRCASHEVDAISHMMPHDGAA